MIKKIITKILNKDTKTKKPTYAVFDLNQKRYLYIIQKLKSKIKKKQKIRVCFFVMFDYQFSYKSLYEKMLKDIFFEPFILIIPDTLRGEKHLISSFNQSYNSLSKKYKNVYKGYNIKTKKFTDFSEKMDMVCFQTPYECMTHNFFQMQNFLDKNILPFYVNYAYSVLKYVSKVVVKIDTYSYFWKVFVENKFNIQELKKYEIIKGKNAVVTGFCKMDDLVNQKLIKQERKTIIIAPHHTISNGEIIEISNFLKYSDFFLKLPKLYPNIDFVFRPHPLLIVNLKKPDTWGEVKTKKYFQKMESYPNVTYSKGGDYFDIFANSDGIIHDCGSFLAEYLFTEKPACYMLKNKKSINKWFLPIGKKCLNHCYKAYTKTNILNFINEVIINEKDYMKNKRINFINSTLKINYPNSSQYIIDYIKKELTK